MFSTYGELKSQISDWLVRGDLADKIPSFILLCETDIANKVLQIEVERTVTMNSGALPDDFRSVRVVKSGNSVLNSFDTVQAARAGVLDGDPIGYVIGGNSINVIPEGPVDMTYDAEFVKLSEMGTGDDATNEILLKHPNVYLYGSLLHSAPYLQEDERLGTWATLYSEGVSDLQKFIRRKRFGTTPLVRSPC